MCAKADLTDMDVELDTPQPMFSDADTLKVGNPASTTTTTTTTTI